MVSCTEVARATREKAAHSLCLILGLVSPQTVAEGLPCLCPAQRRWCCPSVLGGPMMCTLPVAFLALLIGNNSMVPSKASASERPPGAKSLENDI